MSDPSNTTPEAMPKGVDHVRRLIEAAVEETSPPVSELPEGGLSDTALDEAFASDGGVHQVDLKTGDISGDVSDEGGGRAAQVYQGCGLPDNSPVQVLGRNKSGYSFLNSDGQVIELAAKSFNANTLMDLFDGNTSFALAHWPRENVKSGTVGFNAGACRDNLMAAAARRGIFRSENRLRGRGAWLSDNEELVLHLGDEVMVERKDAERGDVVPSFFTGDPMRPGLIGDYVYEADEGLYRPWSEPVSARDIRPLLDQFESWNWVRAYSAPRILLGWLGQAQIAGALSERAHIIVQGGSGGGKSTLQELIGFVQGNMKVKVADATEAALSSMLRNQTLPVMFDEFEATEDNRKALAVIDLMRRATSGGTRARGSSDHSAHTSVNQSPFFVSMITPPPLKTEDLNRLMLLQLLPFKPGTARFKPKERDWKDFGPKILRRMLDGWSQLDDRKEIYATRLSELGHGGRGQDTIGTLLACADILLGDDPPDADTLDLWTEGLSPKDMLEYEGVAKDFEQCLTFILQAQPRRWQGQVTGNSIAQIVNKFLGARPPDKDDWDFAKKALALAGLGLVHPQCPQTKRPNTLTWDLFIPNSHSATRDLFAGSKWGGSATSMGSWMFTLTLGEEGQWRKGSGYIDGQKLRGICVPRDVILPEKARDYEAGAEDEN